MIFLINNTQKPKIHVHSAFPAPKIKTFSAFISFFVWQRWAQRGQRRGDRHLCALEKPFFTERLASFSNTSYLCRRKMDFYKNNDMSKYEIPFLTACIQAFGRRFSMTRQAAFRYLHEHKGLAFLIEFYDVEHLQTMDETIDDLLIICQKNGGTLA